MNNLIENPYLAVITGFFYLLSTAIILYFFNKRNRFSFILIFSEFFYIVAIGVGCIYLAFPYADSDAFYLAYVNRNGPIDDITFYHIILYSIGMLLGAFSYKNNITYKNIPDEKLISSKDIDSQISNFRKLIFLGFIFLGVYVYLVDITIAFTTAARSRAGIMDGLEDATSFLFLKNIAQIGVFSVIFLPLIFEKNKPFYDLFFLTLFGILLYILTGARGAILDTIFFSILIYLSRKNINLKKIIMLFIFFGIGILFSLYGKGLNDDIFNYLLKQELGIAAVERDISIQSFMTQFIGLIFSIDAGIKNFMENGPTISKSIFLSPLGVMPSWLFTSIGLDSLNWKSLSANDDIVCLNTMMYPDAEGCTIPPYYTGVSGYLLPLSGGLVFGFIRFYFFSFISYKWQRFFQNPKMLSKYLLAYILFAKLSLFIPNVISLISFFGICYFIYFCLLNTKKYIGR